MNMKLYTKNICPKCKWVKSEIKQKGLEVSEINMDDHPEAKELILSQGIMAAPVLEVNGEFIADTTKIIAKLEELSE